jgi:hypothetical protein
MFLLAITRISGKAVSGLSLAVILSISQEHKGGCLVFYL